MALRSTTDVSPSSATAPVAATGASRQLRPRKRVAASPDMDDTQDYRTLDAATIVECPICQRKFDAVALNTHLDRGCDPSETTPPPRAATDWLTGTLAESSTTKRLTRPQYQMKSERDLKKMLEVRV